MERTEGPLLHRRRLGAEIRKLRGSRTLEEVADGTLISTSKLSRLENGQGVPQPRDIRDLVAYYRLSGPSADRLRRWAAAGRSQAWWREYSPALPPNLDTYLDFESGASTIRTYASALVPPLLQTERYAAVVQLAVLPAKSEEAVQRLIKVHERRQALLVDSEVAPALIVILDEAVLRRPVGTVAEMRNQLDHLLAVGGQKNVSVRVVPFEGGVHAGIQGSFTILQYEHDIDRDIVAVESHTGERLLEQPTDVLEYLRIFDAISRKALDPQASQDFIDKVKSRSCSPGDVV